MKVALFYLTFTVPASVVCGFLLGGVYTFLTPLLLFVLIPIIDLLDKKDYEKPAISDANNLNFRIIPILYAVLQIALVIGGGYIVGTQNLSTLEWIGFVSSVGISTGAIGFTAAHELIHKKNILEKSLGKSLLLVANYLHFYIEHRIGHHNNVCTPVDPSSARLGESFFKFYPRTVINSFRSAWKIENQRINRKYKISSSANWDYRNRMIGYVLLPIFFAIGLGLAFGWKAVLYFYIQSIIAFSILEIVNYIEHYGLERKKLQSGRYERVTAAHAWDCNLRFSNYIFFKFQRHADHHLHPQKGYQELEYHEESPELPTGYAGMAILALIPPLWRKLMDPKVRKIQERKQQTHTFDKRVSFLQQTEIDFE